jgi:hypothetical protein
MPSALMLSARVTPDEKGEIGKVGVECGREPRDVLIRSSTKGLLISGIGALVLMRGEGS